MTTFVDGPRTLRRFDSDGSKTDHAGFRTNPMTPLIGAEISGLDLSSPLPEPTFQGLHRALLEWKVLFLRDQHLTSDQQLELASWWGESEVNPFFPMGDAAAVSRLSRDMNVAGMENVFHADHTFMANPSFGAILRAIDVPPAGGDTIWVDMAAAYDNLSDDVKEQIDGMTAVHDWIASHGRFMTESEIQKMRDLLPPVEHPLVVVHPETGRKTLYVNEPFTMNIVGIDPHEGDRLLSHLAAQARIPEYQVRFPWKPNSVAIWDNRATQHYAVNDYYPATRVMERVAIAGWKA